MSNSDSICRLGLTSHRGAPSPWGPLQPPPPPPARGALGIPISHLFFPPGPRVSSDWLRLQSRAAPGPIAGAGPPPAEQPRGPARGRSCRAGAHRGLVPGCGLGPGAGRLGHNQRLYGNGKRGDSHDGWMCVRACMRAHRCINNYGINWKVTVSAQSPISTSTESVTARYYFCETHAGHTSNALYFLTVDDIIIIITANSFLFTVTFNSLHNAMSKVRCLFSSNK